MGVIHNLLDVSQTVCAAMMCLYFPGARFKRFEERKHNATPFIWLLVAMFLVSGGVAAVSIAQGGGVPDIQPLAATLLSILALLLQIDHLLPSTAEEKQPVWHALLGTWIIMAMFEMLNIFKLTIMPYFSEFNLVCSAVATSLRCCLVLALFVMFAFPDHGGHIRLEDDTINARNNLNNGRDGKRPGSPELGQEIREIIRAAGGAWRWAKRFHILPWILPSSLLLKLCVFISLVIRLGEKMLILYVPYVDGVFVESVMQAYASRDPGPVWNALTWLMFVRLAMSGLASLQDLLWRKFMLSREERVKTRIYTHLMCHEAAFHDTADPTDVTVATHLGTGVCNTLDFMVMEAVQNIWISIITIIIMVSLYGPHVALVLMFVATFNTLVVLRSNRVLMPKVDARIMAFQDIQRKAQDGLRAWRTVTLHGQTEREITAYATSLGMHMGLRWQCHLIELVFSLASNIIMNSGLFAATALVILHGLQTGRPVQYMIAFSDYWDRLRIHCYSSRESPGASSKTFMLLTGFANS